MTFNERKRSLQALSRQQGHDGTVIDVDYATTTIQMLWEALSQTQHEGVELRRAFQESEVGRTQLRKLLERAHEVLDDLDNSPGSLCPFCIANTYDGRSGRAHQDGCFLVAIRRALAQEAASG